MSESPTNVEAQSLNYQRLRTTGILNIVIGTVSLFISLSMVSANLSYLIPAIISVLTIVASLRAVLAPIPQTFRAFGLLFLAAGLWHVAVALLRIGGGNTLIVGALGVFQIIWSLQWFGQWRGRPREQEAQPQESL